MYYIKIITDVNSKEFDMLKKLIEEFATNVYVVQKFDLQNKNKQIKNNYLNNYKNIISSDDKKLLEQDIKSRIDFAIKSIQNKDENKITRYYALFDDKNMIGFQTAQVRKEKETIEGWRNFAYIRDSYSGKVGVVENTYGEKIKGFLSNVVYENITRWFMENNVSIERTATGKNMKKNIATYMYKGFTVDKTDDTRIYMKKIIKN